jgi:hypothetical protein
LLLDLNVWKPLRLLLPVSLVREGGIRREKHHTIIIYAGDEDGGSVVVAINR